MGRPLEKSRLRPGEPHALVHLRERRRRRRAGLLRAQRQQTLQLGRVGAELAVAGLDRADELDHGLGDVGLEVAVALAVIARLDRVRRLTRRDGHDRDEILDSLLAGTAPYLAP